MKARQSPGMKGGIKWPSGYSMPPPRGRRRSTQRSSGSCAFGDDEGGEGNQGEIAGRRGARALGDDPPPSPAERHPDGQREANELAIREASTRVMLVSRAVCGRRELLAGSCMVEL